MSIVLYSTCLATYSLLLYPGSPVDSRDSRDSGRCKVYHEEVVLALLVTLRVTILYLLASDLVWEW